jgi:hypothetical protein
LGILMYVGGPLMSARVYARMQSDCRSLTFLKRQKTARRILQDVIVDGTLPTSEKMANFPVTNLMRLPERTILPFHFWFFSSAKFLIPTIGKIRAK